MKEKNLFVWDGINCQLEEVDSIEEAREFIKENFIEDGNIHPDIESVFVLQRVASVIVDDTTGVVELISNKDETL